MIRKSCNTASCLSYAVPGAAHCSTHKAPSERLRTVRKGLRRAAKPGDGAAKRVRRQTNKADYVVCPLCGGSYYPVNCEVDHIIPLADGGTDYRHNVQVLCKGCHKEKTIKENRLRALKKDHKI